LRTFVGLTPKVEHNSRAFLKGLNSGEGTPLEQLSHHIANVGTKPEGVHFASRPVFSAAVATGLHGRANRGAHRTKVAEEDWVM
jgi:hypothetical protein